MLKCVKINYKILLLKFKSYIHFLLFSFSLSLFLFFLDKPDWCLDWQNLVFVRSNDHSTVKGICRLVCNVRSCWSCLTHEVFKI